MGKYINIGNAGFQRARNSEYVDKSGLIAVVNSTLFTERCFSCVTRCRRFGKSMAAKMLYAYYDYSSDKDADSAINQIHRKQYPAKVAEHTGDLLLVGINYDKNLKTHQCKIEKTIK